MCLILLAWRSHPDFDLVVAANRDEFFVRPTAQASFWDDAPGILAGRDLEAGGTWMGVARNGRFAALTNFRAPEHHLAGRPSRGRLVADFLAGDDAPADYLGRSAAYGAGCNGYNLLVADRDRLWWATNIGGERRELPPGVYGVSNHLLDTPWPKVGAGKTALAQAIHALPDDTGLLALLRDDGIHPDASLPQTGVSLEWERLLSSAFVRSPAYGTRSSTILLRSPADRGGRIVFDEQTWLPAGRPGPRRRFSFR